MSCERCKDIHSAQHEGNTDKPCKCDCHNASKWTNTGSATCTGTNATACQEHGFTFTNGICTSDGCGTINLN